MNLPFFAKKRIALQGGGQHPGSLVNITGICKKRAIIESVNDELKNICQIEHTRHRSFANFLTNLLAGLIAYSFLPKKPSINLEIIDNKALTR